jgi:hypothetical protein
MVVDTKDVQYRQGSSDKVIADAMAWVLERVVLTSVSWSHPARNGGDGLGVIHRGEQQRNTHPKEDSWQPKQN